MSEREWTNVAISACLEKAFAGEWGAEPAPANAVVLRATDIDNDGHVVGVGAPRAIPKGKLSAKQMIDGDILLEGSGGSPDNPVGRVALFETADHVQPTICSNFFKTLRPNRQLINERFLWRKLCWFYRQPALLSMQQQTTGIINLKFQDYLAAEITLPADKAEQAKIAEVLDTLDTTIRQTEAFIEKLKQVKQGLLHDLLTRGIDANGELRPPQSKAPHFYKASPLGWIPDEWTVKSLEACSVKITDRDHTTPVYLREGVMMISPTNLFDEDGIDFDSAKRISPRAHEINRKKTDLKPGDLIIHRIGAGLGRVRLITADMPPFSILHSMAQIRPDLAAMQSEFMLWALRTHATQLQIEHGTQSIGVPDLGLDKIGSILVVAPPLDEQRRIVVPLVAHKAKLAAATSELGKLRKLKSGLMDDLLTGRVRVTPLLAQQAA